jgi:hypothetical protein
MNNNFGLLSSYENNTTFLNATVTGNTAYLAAGEQGLIILDVSNSKSPKLISNTGTFGYVSSLALSGKNLIITNENEGLKVVDVSNPKLPKEISKLDLAGSPQEIALAGSMAFASDFENGLVVVDISDPTNLKVVSSLPISHAKTIALSADNKLAIIISDETDVIVVDISDTKKPKQVGSLTLDGNLHDAAFISNKVAVVAAGTDGLKVLDLSKLSKPVIASIFATQDSANALTVIGQNVLVADGEKGITAINVKNSQKPLLLDNLPNDNSASIAIAVGNNVAYLLTASKSHPQFLSVALSNLTSDVTNITTDVIFDGRIESAKTPTKTKLIGTAKNDSLTGLAGSDTLRGDAGSDYLNGGLGNDSIDGGNGNDTLIGSEGNDYLNAGSDNDSLDGGKGDDTLIGELGNDTLDGGVGVDSMVGGAGGDYYFVDNIKDVVIETDKNLVTGGKDTIESTSQKFVLGENIENLVLKDVGGQGRYGLGNALNNVITGSIGDDKLEGMAGNDTLIAGDGADILDGGLGIDSLVGGKGDDVYIMQNTEDFIKEDKNGGIDRIESTVDFDLGKSENVEQLVLSGKAAKQGIGNTLDNLLKEKEGGNTNNIFYGNQGNDTIYAEGGNDTLEGGAGNDLLYGGDGEDIAIFTGVYDDYTLTVNVDAVGVPQLFIQYDNEYNTGILDGEDELNDVEILQFSDGTRLNKADILHEQGFELVLTGVSNV